MPRTVGRRRARITTDPLSGIGWLRGRPFRVVGPGRRLQPPSLPASSSRRGRNTPRAVPEASREWIVTPPAGAEPPPAIGTPPDGCPSGMRSSEDKRAANTGDKFSRQSPVAITRCRHCSARETPLPNGRGAGVRARPLSGRRSVGRRGGSDTAGRSPSGPHPYPSPTRERGSRASSCPRCSGRAGA